MNVKYVHELLMEYYKERLPEIKKETFERQKQSDNVVVWVAGLSTGAIGFILAKTNNEFVIDILFLKIAVGFFLLTIISAVVFRGYFYNLQQKEADLILNFEGYCHGATCKFYGPIEITEQYTIKQIADSLKNDMGLDYDDWLNEDYLDRDFWVNHYNKWAVFWKKSETDGLKNLAIALSPLMGKLPEEVDETMITNYDNTSQIKNVIALRKICGRAYNGVMLFFLFAIATVAIGFFSI